MDLGALGTFSKVMGTAAKQLVTAATHQHAAATLVPHGSHTLNHAAFKSIAAGLEAGQGALKLVDDAIKLPVGRDKLQVAVTARTAIKQGIDELISLDRANVAGGISSVGSRFEHAGSLLQSISS